MSPSNPDSQWSTYESGFYGTRYIQQQSTIVLGKSLRRMRAVIDVATNRIYLTGPGEYDLSSIMPPGTQTIQCVDAPSGHMVIPCDLYEQIDEPRGVKREVMSFPVETEEIVIDN